MSAAPLRRRAPARPAAPARRPHAAPRRPVPGVRSVRPAGQAVLDRLLSGRLWIGLVFLLLVGIVFFNVDLLRMNRDIATTAQKAETMKRENARLRGDLARLGSSERIQTAAAQRGLVLPAAGEVRYLKADPGADPRNALARLKAGGGAAATDEIPPAQAEPGETAQEQTGTATPQATTPPVTTTPQAPTPQTTAPQPTTTPQTAAPQAPVAVVPQATPQTGQ
jgi:cell division protein FtsL